jgi:hypothetical protein
VTPKPLIAIDQLVLDIMFVGAEVASAEIFVPHTLALSSGMPVCLVRQPFAAFKDGRIERGILSPLRISFREKFSSFESAKIYEDAS